MQWVGDRFFEIDGRWIDAASGRAVRLRLTDERASDALRWSDECARLSRLRHPLINALLDFGAARRHVLFEAYEWQPGAVESSGAALAAEQLAGILASQGISADDERVAYLARPTRVRWNRLVGLVLQPRSALDALEEVLERTTPPGPERIHVRGAHGLGLRTFRDLAARCARLHGFVPIGATTLAAHPDVLIALRSRHVCVLDDDAAGAASAAVSRLVAELSRISTRRHVVVRLHRHPAAGRRDLVLERLSPQTLMAMALADGPDAPTADELAAAAHAAEGRPAAFIAALCGDYPRQRSGGLTVHESPARYAIEPAASPREPPVIAGRVLGSALRAEARAAALARRGRHAAAARVLQRGVRVLTGRHRPAEAAACTLQLGWLALDRGRVERAVEHFTHAASLAGAGVLAVAAAVGHGVALVDADRLIEAEAVLRGAISSSDAPADGVVAAAAALVRCLFWQGRYHDALAVGAAYRDSDGPAAERARLLSICGRCEARVGRAAVRTVQDAQSAAAVSGDARAILSAELAWADILATSGDTRTAQTTLSRAARLARSAHLPLFAARVRIAATRLRGESGAPGLRRETLPPLLARRLNEALASRERVRVVVEPVAELERLLDLAQRAADDRAALGDICRAVAVRLSTSVVALVDTNERTLATEGRNWRPATSALQQVIACGSRVLPDRCREPQEAAEPVRYGGQLIGAVACRWTAGSDVDVQDAAVVLRAAAMSVAAPMRTVLDMTVPPAPAGWGDLLGDSPAAAALRESAVRAARAPFPVLIEGESGSGKELVARAVHRLGPRRDRKFCALNCAALSDDLVEAELFGHTRGAFTGAAGERAGLFEEADGGTIFLDEVGELSARAQAKLLRVLQEGEVRRVGENLPRRVDVRVVAATNRRLEDEVGAGRFRADLRFRLDVVRISVPPLRERVADIALLAAHFWREASARVGSHAVLSEDALSMLARYDWPGNVRELQNVIAWIAVHSPRRGRVGPSALPAHVAQAAATTACTFEAAREEFERRFIRAALAGANGRRSRAADALGITRQGLAKMMRRLRIEVP